MLRLIGKRIMINKGDTGMLILPNIAAGCTNAVAVLTVYDKLYKQKIIEKATPAVEDMLSFSFESQDTSELEPRTYYWDVKIYHNPLLDEDDFPLTGSVVDSYYGSFNKLPKFIVTGVV